MIVVVIIGIIVIGAVLSLGATGKDSALEQERDRLSALIAYLRERGAMLTLEYGIRCGQHGYRFVFYDNRLMQWKPETVDDTLRPRRLPAGLQFRLLIEGRPIVLDDKALKINTTATTPPGGTISLLGSSSGLSGVTGAGGISGSLSGGSSGIGSSGLGSSALVSSSGGLLSGGAVGSSSGSTGLNDQASGDTPQILLYSNGDTNTFALTIERVGIGRSATLQSSDDGSVKAGDIVEVKQ
jgi:hypothetical protein